MTNAEKEIANAALKYLNVYIGESGKVAFGEDAERLSVIPNFASKIYSILSHSYIGFTKLKEEDMLLNRNITIDEYIDKSYDHFAKWWNH